MAEKEDPLLPSASASADSKDKQDPTSSPSPSPSPNPLPVSHEEETQPPPPPPVPVSVSEHPTLEEVASIVLKSHEPTPTDTATSDPIPNTENQQLPFPTPATTASFKEESNLVSDLSENERRCLQELKFLVEDAGLGNDSIWGIPLLKDDRTDVILLKFLRARDFKVKDSLSMLRNTLQWRKDFGIDSLVDEDLGDDLDKVVFMHGHDRDGHPVCYNVYGEFQNRELYSSTFSDEDKRMRFLRWRIQFLERSIRKLDFRPGGVSTIFQISDLKNSPGPGKRELRQATKQALQLLQDNYPEFVAKQVFINVPWWHLAFYTMMSPFLTQRTKSKFVFASPAKSPETIFKYISPEQVPVQFGGLSVDYCECNPDFTVDDPAAEIIVKPATKQNVEILIYEKCTIVWELRVVGWEVSYGAEFVPDSKEGYTIIIQKAMKMSPHDESIVRGSFKVAELGKLLLTVDNRTSKRKKLLHRFKIEPYAE